MDTNADNVMDTISHRSNPPQVVSFSTPTIINAPMTLPLTTERAVEVPSAPEPMVAIEAPPALATHARSSAKPKAASDLDSLDLSRELALLDRANGALASGDAARALESLDRHARAFPRGKLAEESTALRIRA